MIPNGGNGNGDAKYLGPAWLRATVILGVPAVIALYLVFQMANVQTARILINGERIGTLQGDFNEHAVLVNQHATETRTGFEGIHRLLRQICINTSDSLAAARANCQ